MVILFDQYNMPDDIFEIIFSTSQQRIVGKVLISTFKENNMEMSKGEMSLFATRLHEGNLVTSIDEDPFKGKKVRISYNKRQFYDRILTPMRSMGLIDYDLYRRTYKLSDRFSKLMMEIGMKWSKEIKKQDYGFRLEAEQF